MSLDARLLLGLAPKLASALLSAAFTLVGPIPHSGPGFLVPVSHLHCALFSFISLVFQFAFHSASLPHLIPLAVHVISTANSLFWATGSPSPLTALAPLTHPLFVVLSGAF